MVPEYLKTSIRKRQKLRIFMDIAQRLSMLSTCKRKPCGAILVAPDFSEIVAIGYNGPLSGAPNDSCPGKENCGCFHAEENCLIKSRRYDRNLTMIVTRAPCAHCAGLIINSRTVARVVWGEPSTKGVEGIELLCKHNIIEWRAE